jgi:predicted Zn-dependent protease
MRLSLLLALLLPVLAQDRGPRRGQQVEAVDDVDHVDLAALMIGDGHWDRARSALEQVDVSDPELDAARYWTLLGLVELHDQDHPAAAVALQSAIDAGATDPRLHSHLARALASGPEADLIAAWRVLDAAQAQFPDETLYDEQRILILVELGLTQAARDLGTQVQADRGLSVESQMAIASAMQRSGRPDQAILVLEAARLQQPDHPDVPLHLARMYLAEDMPLAAGQILQIATTGNPALALEAAECFRRAGLVDRALMVNGDVPDPVAKSRQRLGLLLEAQAWERAIALQPRLDRLGLLSEDEVLYGLAYAWFQVGEVGPANELLKQIQDPAVFERATSLRAAMDVCVQAGSCR